MSGRLGYGNPAQNMTEEEKAFARMPLPSTEPSVRVVQLDIYRLLSL